MSRKPSEQLTEQKGFTAFSFEDVGTLINHSNADSTCLRVTTLVLKAVEIRWVHSMATW